MSSSTSNSNDRLPDGPWGKTWFCTLLLTGAALLSVEAFWRTRGIAVDVSNDPVLWALTRAQVQEHDPCETVLVGTSRMQFGINREAFAAAFCGQEPVQLAVFGSNGLPVLRHLSEQDAFRGIVICDAHPEHFLYHARPFRDHDHELKCVQAYEQRTCLRSLERMLQLTLEERVALIEPALAPLPIQFYTWFSQRSLPEPRHRVMRGDRSFETIPPDWKSPTEYLPETRPSVSTQEFEQNLDELENVVRKLRSHGGKAVFVVLPTGGRCLALERELYPRARYWDRFAAHTSALAIHWEDYPELRGFHCSDGSHLDGDETAAFTSALAAILAKKLDRVASCCARPNGSVSRNVTHE